MSSQTDVAAQLAAVQEGFIAKIPAKMASITESWQAFKTAGHLADDLKKTYQGVHALAGTSGVLSIGEVHALSNSMQLLLLKMMADELEFDVVVADIDGLITQLHDLVDSAHYEKAPIDLK